MSGRAYCHRIYYGLKPWIMGIMLSVFVLLSGSAWSAPGGVALKSLLNDALRLVYAGKSAEAYTMLAPKEDDYAGNRDYDYLLGVSALDSGNPEIAVFALQRALAVDPLFSGARMDLARAYFVLEQYSYAQEEFRILLAQNPPKKIVANIHRYQQDIDRRQAKPRTRFSAYGETGLGYDTNANSATDEQTFLGFQLGEESTRNESPYSSLQTGISLFVPLGQNTQLFAGTNIKRRTYTEATFVNNTVYDGNLLLHQRVGVHALHWGVNGNAVNVAGEPNSRATGTMLAWNQQITEAYQLNVSSRYGQTRYPKALRVKDVDQRLWSVKLSRSALRPLFSEYGLQLIRGRDFQVDATTAYEKQFTSGSLYGQFPLTSRMALTTTLALADSEYRGPFFGQQRTDNQQSYSIELRWLLAPGWIVKTQMSYTQNKSDIKIYQYDKTDIGLSLRWNFLN